MPPLPSSRFPFLRPSASRLLLAATVALSAAAAAPAAAQTRMLRSPTVSATQIAFAYAENIWVVDRAGGTAQRLTSFQGTTGDPGVLARRQADRLHGYLRRQRRRLRRAGGRAASPRASPGTRGPTTSPAGRPTASAWCSRRDAATEAPTGGPAFWTVPVDGGAPEPMPMPRAYQGRISPDGKYVAYRMNNSWDEERRNYRGGQNRPIWILNLKTFDLVSPALEGLQGHRSGVGGRQHRVLHLRSRRRGERLVVRHRAPKKLAQVTDFSDYDVKTLERQRRRRGVRAGGVRARTRPEDGQASTS